MHALQAVQNNRPHNFINQNLTVVREPQTVRFLKIPGKSCCRLTTVLLVPFAPKSAKYSCHTESFKIRLNFTLKPSKRLF